MSAREGKRMRTLTARWPKPILPIEGRPVVTTLLHELAAAGLRRVTVVVGYLGEQIEALVGDGRAFGVAVRYARQPEPVGSADAVARALLAGAGPPLLVSAADTVYRAGDVERAARAWLASGAAGAWPFGTSPASRWHGASGSRTASSSKWWRTLRPGRRGARSSRPRSGSWTPSSRPGWPIFPALPSSSRTPSSGRSTPGAG